MDFVLLPAAKLWGGPGSHQTLSRIRPCHKLTDAIDLVVVSAIGKGAELLAKIAIPIGTCWDDIASVKEPRRLLDQPSLLVGDAGLARENGKIAMIAPQLLDELRA